MHETQCRYWKELKFLMFDLLKLHHLFGIERKKKRKERKEINKERKEIEKRNQIKRKKDKKNN